MKKITKKMRLVIEQMALHPTYSYRKICNELGEVTPTTISLWMRHDMFKEALEQKRKEVWKDYAAECQELMMELARNGNFQAVKYVLDYAGYGAPQQIELNSNVIKVSIDE